MDKYILNPAHVNDTIITKTTDGHEIVVTKANFNDYFAECMLRCGQTHLVKTNAEYKEELVEKKTYVQISENVILSTLPVDQIGKPEQNQTANEPESNQKGGKRFQKKASKQTQDLNQQK